MEMRYLIIVSILLIPMTSFAWSKPTLANVCGEFSISLDYESNQVIEFSVDNFKTILGEIDFISSGKHKVGYKADTLYARYKSDKRAESYSTSNKCEESVKEEVKEVDKKKSSKRRKKHSIIRKPAPPVVLPLFDLPLFDYPEEVIATPGANDKG